MQRGARSVWRGGARVGVSRQRLVTRSCARLACWPLVRARSEDVRRYDVRWLAGRLTLRLLRGVWCRATRTEEVKLKEGAQSHMSSTILWCTRVFERIKEVLKEYSVYLLQCCYLPPDLADSLTRAHGPRRPHHSDSTVLIHESLHDIRGRAAIATRSHQSLRRAVGPCVPVRACRRSAAAVADVAVGGAEHWRH